MGVLDVSGLGSVHTLSLVGCENIRDIQVLGVSTGGVRDLRLEDP